MRAWVAQAPGERRGKVWRLRRVLAGMREGPKLWLAFFAGFLSELGYRSDPTNPNYFTRVGADLLEVHMDDLYATDERECLEKLGLELSARFGVKFVVHDAGAATYEHLRRTRVRTEFGMHIAPGEHHIRHLVSLFGFAANAKPKPTPLPVSCDTTFAGTALDADGVSAYRRGVGIALYVATDRADIQYAVGLLSQQLKAPTAEALAGLKHLVRYLAGTSSVGLWFPAGGRATELTATSDSNWANCAATRRSTSCGIVACAGCCLFSFARRQSLVSLSSAEAEFYAACSAISEALAIKRLLLLAGFGPALPVRARLDSSSARALLQRRGVGRVRHLDARVLWAQELVERRAVVIATVRGADNEADIGTKLLPGPRLSQLMQTIGLCSAAAFDEDGRPRAAGVGEERPGDASVASVAGGLGPTALQQLVRSAVAACLAEAVRADEGASKGPGAQDAEKEQRGGWSQAGAILTLGVLLGWFARGLRDRLLGGRLLLSQARPRKSEKGTNTPFGSDILYVAPHHGEKYHTDRLCKGLLRAAQVRSLGACRRCFANKLG